MKTLIFIPLLIIGCGPRSIEPGDTVCYADGVTVHLEFKADCAKVARNVALAKKMAIEIKLVMPDDSSGPGLDFAGVYKDTEITILPVTEFCDVLIPGQPCTELWGHYGYGNDIRAECSSKVLLHEMAHRIEQLSFDRCTNHESWATWGWAKADEDYRKLSENTCFVD